MGSREAFVRTFRRYPLEDLREAERQFRARACRCKVQVCDRYFSAVVRDVTPRATLAYRPSSSARARATAPMSDSSSRHLLRPRLAATTARKVGCHLVTESFLVARGPNVFWSTSEVLS
jgi:hypothetical protein